MNEKTIAFLSKMEARDPETAAELRERFGVTGSMKDYSKAINDRYRNMTVSMEQAALSAEAARLADDRVKTPASTAKPEISLTHSQMQSEEYVRQVVSQLKGETPAYTVTDTLSNDGIIRNEADIQAVIKELRGETPLGVLNPGTPSSDGIARTEADLMAVVNELRTASGY